MNIKLTNTIECGNMYSIFMLMLPNIQYVDENIDNIYFNSIDSRFPENPFNWIFDQDENITYRNIICKNHGVYTKSKLSGGPIEDSILFNNFKEVASVIKIKLLILEKINLFCDKNITKKTLGVHIRVGDMNVMHPEFGIYHTDDYIRKTQDVIDNEDIDKIFIASDNHTSIEKIKSEFKNVVFNDCLLREISDSDKYSNVQPVNLNNPNMWEEAFIDMYLLSKCSKLICRVSNVVNSSLIFSKTINKIYRL